MPFDGLTHEGHPPALIVLQNTRAILDAGWMQHALYSYQEKGFTYCLVGAYRKAYCEYFGFTESLDQLATTDTVYALDPDPLIAPLLFDQLPKITRLLNGKRSKLQALFRFNDRFFRNKAEILALIDRTIDALRQSESDHVQNSDPRPMHVDQHPTKADAMALTPSM